MSTAQSVRMARAAAADRPLVGTVGISHPDRVIYPDQGTTKLALAHYYESVADAMLPHVKGRPLTLVRCPDGIAADGRADTCFYMKHSKLWAPPALRRVRIREKTKTGEYLVADTPDALVSLVQMGVVEVHTWNSTCDDLERPDRVVLDIDPGVDVGWPAVVDAARQIRDLLGVLGLQTFVKTTGGRGLHVVVPLVPKANWQECLAFARAVAEALTRSDPGSFTMQFAKAGRERLMLIDYLRNNRTNTSVAAFSTRARHGAPVSVPLTWRELTTKLGPERFTMATVPARLRRATSDAWSGYFEVRQTLPPHAVEALNRM
ncbi:MAG: non-homologous end-joining DNA ligase [Vicinamibacterales bacterium]